MNKKNDISSQGQSKESKNGFSNTKMVRFQNRILSGINLGISKLSRGQFGRKT